MTYTGTKNTRYTIIEPALGKGGEGSVYRISGMPDYVLKVFDNKHRTETRHRKLQAMISTPLTESAMKQITWPIDVVYENGRFIGYVMPEAKQTEELNVAYSNKACTLDKKIVMGMNLCAAINSVHNAGQVCGDLKPENICVDPVTARITLVDTDSYHITDYKTNNILRCEVGLPEYFPYEIQCKLKPGILIADIPLPTFSEDTDNFALAVHIFKLLMNGCHPYACAKDNINTNASNSSVTAPQPIENILNGFFSFTMKKPGITPPKYAPSFDSLPKDIQALFVRAFVDGHKNHSKRPKPEEWYKALSSMAKNLKKCSSNSLHMYASHNKTCPYCEAEKAMRNITIPQNTAITPKVSIQQIQFQPNSTQQTSTQQTSTQQVSNSSTLAPQKPKLASKLSTFIYYLITILISLGSQALVLYFTDIAASLFGTKIQSGIEFWGLNIAIWAGPWAFLVCGLIGILVYNYFASGTKKFNGYKWYHFLLSLICSYVAAALWVLVVLILAFAIPLIAVVGIIALICAIFANS